MFFYTVPNAKTRQKQVLLRKILFIFDKYKKSNLVEFSYAAAGATLNGIPTVCGGFSDNIVTDFFFQEFISIIFKIFL
jgi:hypothetical protein